MATSRRYRRLKKEVDRWLLDPAYPWDVGIALHIPNAMRQVAGKHSMSLLQQQVGYFLNDVDRRIYKSAHKRRGVRVPRIVAAEWDEGVGWHAHAVLITPPTMTKADFVDFLQRRWHARVGRYATAKFRSRLFWGEAIRDNYGHYTIKRTIGSPLGISDFNQGFLDLQNTTIPV